jgi:hypothetical protein
MGLLMMLGGQHHPRRSNNTNKTFSGFFEDIPATRHPRGMLARLESQASRLTSTAPAVWIKRNQGLSGTNAKSTFSTRIDER